MANEFQFQFSNPGLPEGEALTASEMEQKWLETLDAKDGNCPETLSSLAMLYQRTGRFDQASACIRRVIELIDDPEKIGSGFLALGQIEETRGHYAAAVKYYREALALEPCSNRTWYFIYNNLGYSLNQLGQHSAAVPYLQKAVEIDPERLNAYKNLGVAHEALGDPIKAAGLFIAATQVNATDSRSFDHLLAMMEANPALEVDIPDLQDRVEACRNAIEFARDQQPDFDTHWANLREKQRPK